MEHAVNVEAPVNGQRVVHEAYFCECNDKSCHELLKLSTPQFLRVLDGSGYIRSKKCKSEKKGELIEDFGDCEWLSEGDEK